MEIYDGYQDDEDFEHLSGGDEGAGAARAILLRRAPGAEALETLSGYLHTGHLLALDASTCAAFLVSRGDAEYRTGGTVRGPLILDVLRPGQALELARIHRAVTRWLAYVAGTERGEADTHAEPPAEGGGRSRHRHAQAVLVEAARLHIADLYRQFSDDVTAPGGPGSHAAARSVAGAVDAEIRRQMSATRHRLVQLAIVRARHIDNLLDRSPRNLDRPAAVTEAAGLLGVNPQTISEARAADLTGVETPDARDRDSKQAND